MKSNSTIHVALASDDNYFEGLLVTAWTIARNCSRPERISFHILDGGISQEHRTSLETALSSKCCKIDWLTIDTTATFGNFNAYHGSGHMTYARLLLPDLLPHVHTIIYSDVDFLWLVNIAELWDSLDEKAIIHYVPKILCPLSKSEADWFADHGFSYEVGTRFCAGMLVLNLDKFRDEKLHIKMIQSIADSNGHVPCNDETVLNAYMFWRKDRIALPRRWQRMSIGAQDRLEQQGFALHFCVDAPFLNLHQSHLPVSDAHILWHRFHAEIRQISIWQSMRMFSPIADILLFRICYLAASRSFLMRKLLHLVMVIRGRSQFIPTLNAYLHKFSVKSLDPWLLPA